MGIILVLAAIPLALRWVPRNYLYGYRMPYALSSDEAWYRANTVFGRVTIVVGLLSLVPDVLVVQLFDRRTASTISIAILLVAILASFVGTWLILRGTPAGPFERTGAIRSGHWRDTVRKN